MKAPRSKNKKWYIGLDLGGTKLAWTLMSENGDVEFYKSQKLELNSTMSPSQSKKKVLKVMAGAVESTYIEASERGIRKSSICGIGLASAGPLNVEKGILTKPANFSGWGKFAIVEKLETELARRGLKKKISFQNDAIAAALAEGWIGGAKGLNTFVVITLGTGIGTGVIFNGRPAQSRGMGSEWGHLIISKEKLNLGEELYPSTVEGIASGTAITKRAQEMGFKGRSVQELICEIESGADKYKTLFKDASRALAILCFNLSMGFHPQKILLSGGMSKAKDYFLDQLKNDYKTMICKQDKSFLAPIALAKLGTQAGAIGAAKVHILR